MKLKNTLFENLIPSDQVDSFMTTRHSKLSSVVKPILKNKHYIVRTRQTHSDNVAVIDNISQKNILAIPNTDALITKLTQTYLTIKVADCMPILLYHQSGWIAAIHAGREGTKKNILLKTLKTLVTLTNEVSGYYCWFGPCICTSCHQIDSQKKIYFSLFNENKAQFDAVFSSEDNRLIIDDKCTSCNSNDLFYSYRGNNFTKKRNYIFIALK